MKYKIRIKLCAWIMWYMYPVQFEESRINHLTPLLVVTMPYAWWFLWHAYYIEDVKWRLHFQFGVAFFKGCFERIIFWRAKSYLKGIEDFNLEHCSRGLYSLVGIVQDWKSWVPFKIYFSRNNPSRRNPKLKMKTALEVLDIICPPQEPTSVGHCHYKK